VPARHGTARHGTARHGTARHGTARHGTAELAQHSTAQHSAAQHGTAQRDIACSPCLGRIEQQCGLVHHLCTSVYNSIPAGGHSVLFLMSCPPHNMRGPEHALLAASVSTAVHGCTDSRVALANIPGEAETWLHLLKGQTVSCCQRCRVQAANWRTTSLLLPSNQTGQTLPCSTGDSLHSVITLVHTHCFEQGLQ